MEIKLATIDEPNLRELIQILEQLISGESNFVANMANACALLQHRIPQIDWVGFYLWDAESKQLVLGPFQGLPASPRIAEGKGLCGEAVSQNTTQQSFLQEGSELAIPLRQGRTIIGVLNVSSQSDICRISLVRDYLELFAARLVSHHVM